MGSWIGRQGRGGELASSYWFSGRNKATISYRKMTVDKAYLQGGNLGDLSANLTWFFHSNIELTATGQYEHWHFPLLGSGSQSNFMSSVGIRFTPKLEVRSGKKQ
jgi:hypothetical protein